MARYYDRHPCFHTNVHGSGCNCRLCSGSWSWRIYFHRFSPGRRSECFELCPGGNHRNRYRRPNCRRCAGSGFPPYDVEGDQRMNQQSQQSKIGAEIELVDVVKRYPGQKEPAVDELSLTVPAGELVMFVGPSGCGKTTSLKMINRLIEPTSGKILIDGDDITTKDPTQRRRRIGQVLQGGGLMPHMKEGDQSGRVRSREKGE